MFKAGFSLASLVLFTVVVAIAMASLRMAIVHGDRLDEEAMVMIGIFGTALGAVVGLTVGLKQPRPVLGVVVGLVGGAAAGPLALVLVANPECILVIAVGSVILIGFAAAVRRFSGPRPS